MTAEQFLLWAAFVVVWLGFGVIPLVVWLVDEVVLKRTLSTLDVNHCSTALTFDSATTIISEPIQSTYYSSV